MAQPRDSRRILGSGANALEVSAQGFGCMGMTAVYGKPMDDDSAVALLRHAYENGVTHWDTAEVYAAEAEDGSKIYNETVVGKAVAALAARDKIQLATKYMPSIHSADDMTEAMVLDACRASCARLGVECVDLYYVHRLHPTVPVEQQARAMKAVRDAGLTRFVGVSEFSPRVLRAFHAICPVTCVQQEWSLMNRDLEAELVPTCRELGIGIVAYSPLCRKILSAEVHSVADLNEGDLRPTRYGRLQPENLVENAKLAQRVAQLGTERGLTAAQLSLAWVASQGDDVCPIPGTTKIAHLDDNIRARAVKLSAEECALVAAAVPQEEVRGNRYVGDDPKKGTFLENL